MKNTQHRVRELFFIRHAIAEDRDVFAQTNSNDDLRPLTERGRKKMHQIAKRLSQLESIDLFLQSPLLRSQQTVKILKEYFPKAKVIETHTLDPFTPENILVQNLSRRKEQSIAVVGHELQLSQTLCYLLTGQKKNFLELKKGGIAKVEYTKNLEIKKVTLKFIVSPKVFI